MFEVFIHKKAKKQLIKLPLHIRKKVIDTLEKSIAVNTLISNPKVKKLHAPLEEYRYKILPYRILYTIKKQEIHVYKIIHRQSGY